MPRSHAPPARAGEAHQLAPQRILLSLATLLLLVALPGEARAQQPEGGIRQDALRVFLDCNTFQCDDDYFRTEIGFVNWVRDRTLAQVHLIITGTQTGGGGNVFTLDFIGLQELEGSDDELTLTTLGSDTEDEVLGRMSRIIGVGLARYSTLIGQPAVFEITAAQPDEVATDRIVSGDQVEDPWDFWVFEASADVEIEGEESERQRQFSGSFDARRTTDTWKIEWESFGNFSRAEQELPDSTVSVDERTNWRTSLLVAYSLADDWSLGVLAGANASTSRNQDFGADAAVAVEYSFFPYEDAPRRSLTASYDLRLQYFDWEEETIFFETEELRPQHQLQLQLFQRQPWGESRVSISGSQFLHDLGKYNVSLGGDVEFRIMRGLDLEVRGDLALIEDQLFISREGLTVEEILQGRFERPTDYTYELSVGLSFEFGSIYNNIVNNRFDRRGGGNFGGGRDNFRD